MSRGMRQLGALAAAALGRPLAEGLETHRQA